MSSIVVKSARSRNPVPRMCGPVLGALLAAVLVSGPAALAQETTVPPPPAAEQPAPPQAGPAQTPPAQTQAPEAELPLATDADAGTDARDTTLPHDLSPWGMFMAADWVVKAVMIGLAFASLVTWTVWLAKTLERAGARARAGRGLKRIVEAASLPEAVRSLETKGGPTALMVRAAAHEMEASRATLAHGGAPGLKERVTSHLSRIEAQAGRRMTRGTGVLATIGSTAPFVGLFGTVWGIMNSFASIAQSKDTSLAVVAPGIAEALFATAIGLIAAIPAVVAYNKLSADIDRFSQRLEGFSTEFQALLSRQLEERAA